MGEMGNAHPNIPVQLTSETIASFFRCTYSKDFVSSFPGKYKNVKRKGKKKKHSPKPPLHQVAGWSRVLHSMRISTNSRKKSRKICTTSWRHSTAELVSGTPATASAVVATM